MPREHGESGEFVETVTLDDVRDVVDEVAGPVVLSADVADRLGCSRETARRKLQQLHDRGELDRRKVARRVIYWRTDESARERGEAPVDEGGDRADTSPTPASPPASTPGEDVADVASSDALAVAVDRVAEGWEDSDERLESRKAAARGVLEYAREHGGVSKQEAKETVYPEYPVEGQNARTWYRKNIRPVLNEVAEYDQSAREYRLTLEES